MATPADAVGPMPLVTVDSHMANDDDDDDDDNSAELYEAELRDTALFRLVGSLEATRRVEKQYIRWFPVPIGAFALMYGALIAVDNADSGHPALLMIMLGCMDVAIAVPQFLLMRCSVLRELALRPFAFYFVAATTCAITMRILHARDQPSIAAYAFMWSTMVPWYWWLPLSDASPSAITKIAGRYACPLVAGMCLFDLYTYKSDPKGYRESHPVAVWRSHEHCNNTGAVRPFTPQTHNTPHPTAPTPPLLCPFRDFLDLSVFLPLSTSFCLFLLPFASSRTKHKHSSLAQARTSARTRSPHSLSVARSFADTQVHSHSLTRARTNARAGTHRHNHPCVQTHKDTYTHAHSLAHMHASATYNLLPLPRGSLILDLFFMTRS